MSTIPIVNLFYMIRKTNTIDMSTKELVLRNRIKYNRDKNRRT